MQYSNVEEDHIKNLISNANKDVGNDTDKLDNQKSIKYIPNCYKHPTFTLSKEPEDPNFKQQHHTPYQKNLATFTDQKMRPYPNDVHPIPTLVRYFQNHLGSDDDIRRP